MTEKPRFSITLDEEMLTKVEDFRHDNRISTRSQAVVKLIELAFASLDAGPDTDDLTPDERLIIDGYHAADVQHQEDMRDAAVRAIERGKKAEKSYTLHDEAGA